MSEWSDMSSFSAMVRKKEYMYIIIILSSVSCSLHDIAEEMFTRLE